MSDYIDREAVKRLLCDNCNMANQCDEIECIWEEVDKIPSANVQDVVYCKDCIHLGFKDFRGICSGGPMCGIVNPWDYCSHGIKKKRGTEMEETE